MAKLISRDLPFRPPTSSLLKIGGAVSVVDVHSGPARARCPGPAPRPGESPALQCPAPHCQRRSAPSFGVGFPNASLRESLASGRLPEPMVSHSSAQCPPRVSRTSARIASDRLPPHAHIPLARPPPAGPTDLPPFDHFAPPGRSPGVRTPPEGVDERQPRRLFSEATVAHRP
jgi:hypothetical protein